MANLNHGYKQGDRIPVRLPVDSSTTAIAVGDMLTIATAGYYKKWTTGAVVYGVAMEQLDTADLPSADGGAYVLADVSPSSVYGYPLSAGTLVVGMRGKTCDAGGAQAVDVTASTNDDLHIVDVDITNQVAFVRPLIPALGGVV